LKSASPGKPVVLCNRPANNAYFDVEARPIKLAKPPMQTGFDYRIEFRDVAGKSDVEVEPNDSNKHAGRLTPARPRTGYIDAPGDVDTYAFAVARSTPTPGHPSAAAGAAKPRKVTVELKGNHLNLAFDIYDSQGGSIARVNHAGAGGDEHLSLQLPPGLYYVKVHAVSGFSCKPYHLRVAVR